MAQRPHWDHHAFGESWAETPGRILTITPGALDPDDFLVVDCHRSRAISVQRVSATAVVEVRAGAAPVGQVIFTVDGSEVRRVQLTENYGGRIGVQLPRLSRGTHQVVARFEQSGVTSSTSAPARLRILL